MNTFSQLVDKMVDESKRPDLKTEIASYLNLTLRELHQEPSKGNSIFYKDNLREIQLLNAPADGLFWEIPNRAVFQGLAGVRYDILFADGNQTWAKEVQPGRIMATEKYYYYRASGNFFFRNYGGLNASVSLAWYEFTPSLKYYVSGTRPAIYDSETGWTYAPSYDVDDDTRALAQALTINWILERWDMVIEEGLRAKIFKRIDDTNRARTSYSLYTQLRQGIYTAEAADLGGSW